MLYSETDATGETGESDATRKFLLENKKKRKLNNRNHMKNQHNCKHKKKTVHTF